MRSEAESPDVASAYHLRGVSLDRRACAGTACFLGRAIDPACWQSAEAQEPRVSCLGKCYASPATAQTRARPVATVAAPRPVVLERIIEGPTRTLAEYVARGGYRAIDRALAQGASWTIEEVVRSGLRGRGGAGFPTGKKLLAVAAQPGPRYVVMNADEGDSGAYIDRALLEDDPHATLEGLVLAAYAVGAEQGIVYLRREYPDALPILEAAIAEARAVGVLGEKVLGRGPAFDVEVVVGQGSYVCGEETALVNSIEGRRPFVRSRPPYPSEKGLHGRPTLVNNVETLANLPWIVNHGAGGYAAMGHARSRGTKVVSLNSLFWRPGLYEVELGTPVHTIVKNLGGGLMTGTMAGVIIGGPLAGVLPPSHFHLPLAFEELHEAGASLGHGGVLAFDASTSIRELVQHVFAFGAYESCGRCTPCRLGARRIERMMMGEGAWESGYFADIVSALRAASLCGHGAGLGEFAESILRHYREELQACFASS
jgi:NADH:ubiquinone oxidoreductase subunit F (NADH-binding)